MSKQLLAQEDIQNYQTTLQDMVSKVQQARYNMLKSVSSETVHLYWSIGEIISKKIEQGKWGSATVEKLAKDLQSEFPGVRGFSARNLWRVKSFYDSYAESKILPMALAEIGWMQNCIIVEKCKNELEREFYIKQTKLKGWSRLDLLDKIEQNYYQNSLLAQNNFNLTVPEDLKAIVAWEFVDDYNVELINPDQPIKEKEIENAIVGNIVKFLQDMGGEFAFVGRQYRVEFEEKEHFIDLLFFNLHLNCYVVFELKARDFDPKDLGQMQMYLMLINKVVKKEEHNPTIGIVVCKDKSRTVVEYLLQSQKEPIGVATYNKYKTLKDLPEMIAKYLPSEEFIIERLGTIGENL